jgi:hypothetical protein
MQQLDEPSSHHSWGGKRNTNIEQKIFSLNTSDFASLHNLLHGRISQNGLYQSHPLGSGPVFLNAIIEPLMPSAESGFTGVSSPVSASRDWPWKG